MEGTCFSSRTPEKVFVQEATRHPAFFFWNVSRKLSKRDREQHPSGGSLGCFSWGTFLGLLTVGGVQGEKQAVEECPCRDTGRLASGQGLTSLLQ